MARKPKNPTKYKYNEERWISRQLRRLVRAVFKGKHRGLSFNTDSLIYTDMNKSFEGNGEFFGAIKKGKCRMPMGDFDSAKAGTWAGKMVVLASSVINDPRSIKDCWYVLGDKGGYHEFKTGDKTEFTKWRTHIVLYGLRKGTTEHMETAGKGSSVHRHLCGHGNGKGTPVCINPWHLVTGTAAQNRDDEGCRYGCAILCPHGKKCVFTHKDTGKTKPCLNGKGPIGPGLCKHNPKCYL